MRLCLSGCVWKAKKENNLKGVWELQCAQQERFQIESGIFNVFWTLNVDFEDFEAFKISSSLPKLTFWQIFNKLWSFYVQKCQNAIHNAFQKVHFRFKLSILKIFWIFLVQNCPIWFKTSLFEIVQSFKAHKSSKRFFFFEFLSKCSKISFKASKSPQNVSSTSNWVTSHVCSLVKSIPVAFASKSLNADWIR